MRSRQTPPRRGSGVGRWWHFGERTVWRAFHPGGTNTYVPGDAARQDAFSLNSYHCRRDPANVSYSG